MSVGEITRNKLNQLRNERGMTIKELSERSGVKYSTLKSFFGGKTREISQDYVALMATAFGMTYREFMDDDIYNDVDPNQIYEERIK